MLPVLTRLETDDDFMRIRPAVTHQQFLYHIADDLPECAELLRRFGALQVRSSGTVCGNIANASPIGDLPPVLMALGSKIELTKANKIRILDLENFCLDYGKQDRQSGEFLSAILVPHGPAPYLRCYKISKRFDQDISAVMLAANLHHDDGVMTDVCLAFGVVWLAFQNARITPKQSLSENRLIWRISKPQPRLYLMISRRFRICVVRPNTGF